MGVSATAAVRSHHNQFPILCVTCSQSKVGERRVQAHFSSFLLPVDASQWWVGIELHCSQFTFGIRLGSSRVQQSVWKEVLCWNCIYSINKLFFLRVYIYLGGCGHLMEIMENPVMRNSSTTSCSLEYIIQTYPDLNPGWPTWFSYAL